MAELPVAQLGEVAAVQSGFAFKSSQWKASGVPVVKIANVKRGYIDLLVNPSFITEEDAERARRFRLAAGDIVVGMTGSFVGEVAKVKDDRHIVLNQRVGIFRVDVTKADPSFLYYATANHDFRTEAQALAYGSAQPNISPTLLESIVVPLPSLPEQRRIAGVLGALDDLIDTNEKLIRLMSTESELLFKKRFGYLEGSDTSFVSLVKVTGGGTPKTSVAGYWNGSIPWFSVVDTPSEGQPWVFDTQKRITELGLKESSAKLIPMGTVILSARGTVGNTALTAAPMAMNQSCYALNCALGGSGYFTYFATNAIVDRLKQAAHGSVFDTITQKSLESITVSSLTSVDVAEFETGVAPMMIAARELGLEVEQLRRTRDELLPLLMSGKIRVREAEELVKELVA